jgi:hypothetical protein
MHCPNCGAVNEPDQRICISCGIILSRIVGFLIGKGATEDVVDEQTADLVRHYLAGRKLMVFGARQMVVGALLSLIGIVITIELPDSNISWISWILFALFIGLFANGAGCVVKGWNESGNYGSQIKALGYRLPPISFRGAQKNR